MHKKIKFLPLFFVCLLCALIFVFLKEKSSRSVSENKVLKNKASVIDKTEKLESRVDNPIDKNDQQSVSRIKRKYTTNTPSSSYKEDTVDKMKKETLEKEDTETESTDMKESDNPLDKIMGNYVEEMYRDYFSEVNLDPKKRKKLTKVLVESHQLQQSVVYMLFDNKMEDEAILRKQEELFLQQKTKTENLLNKNELDVLDSYNQELPKKIAQKTIDTSLQHLDLPRDMKKDLSKVIYEEKQNTSSLFGYGNNSGIPLKMLDQENISYIRNLDKPEEIEKIINKTEIESEKILNRFKDEKNPSEKQLEIVKSFLGNATAMLRSVAAKQQK